MLSPDLKEWLLDKIEECDCGSPPMCGVNPEVAEKKLIELHQEISYLKFQVAFLEKRIYDLGDSP